LQNGELSDEWLWKDAGDLMENYRTLLIILILALLVRSVFIGSYFTGDAIDTVGPARNYAEIGRAAFYATNSDTSMEMARVEDGLYFVFTHPPMRTLLYSLWAVLFGFNSLMILLPIIIGILSIFFIYLTGRQLYSEKTGLIAALLAALIRYHFYSSTIAFGDNLLMLTVAASMYFFCRYIATKRSVYLAPFFIFFILGFLTKLSAIAIIPVLLATAFILNEKIKFKTSFLAVAAVVSLSFLAVYFSYPITESLTGVSNQDFNFFESYIKTFMAARVGYQDIAYEKAFYASSFLWQMTPFFAALLLIALIRLKRNKAYLILSSWLVITFLIGFASSGQDFQRLMVIAIAPAIILVAQYISDIKWEKNRAYILFGAATAFILAYLTGLNDMLPYYNLSIVAFFFLIAGIFIFMPKNKQLLLGASIGLSVFFLIGTNFLIAINSSAVQQLVSSVEERDYPYKELWTTRDISLYLAPAGEPSFLQRPELSEKFIRENGVKYVAFYSVYEEEKIITISSLCEDEPFFAVVNGRRVGLACKISAVAPK